MINIIIEKFLERLYMFPQAIIPYTGNTIPNEVEMFLSEMKQNSIQLVQPTSRARDGAPARMYQRRLVSETSWGLYGSPYMHRVTYSSGYPLIWRHCFPDMETYLYHVNNNDAISYFERSAVLTFNSYSSITRNEYTSTSWTSFQGHTVSKFVYYDPVTERMKVYNPSAGGTPTFYYT